MRPMEARTPQWPQERMASSNASTEISPSISPMRKRPKAAPPTITKVIVSARKAYKRRSGGAASRAPRDVMSRGSNGQARRPWAIEIQAVRSEEHTSELQSLMRISYAVFCLKKKNKNLKQNQYD